MSHKRLSIIGLAAYWGPCALVLAVAQPLPARAAETRLALDYDVYVGGIHAVKLEAGLKFESESYAMDIAFQTSGWIGRLMPWSMRSRAEGRLEAIRTRPRKARSASIWNGKARSIALDYRDDGRIVARVDPPHENDEREPVPDELRRDTVDLPSAILTMLRAVAQAGTCGKTVPVFDGRRRYDLVMRPAGKEMIAPSTYSPFKGVATICNARMIRIKGFQEASSWRDSWDDYKREAVAWIAPVFDGVPPVPVRIEIDTPFGAIRAHLAGARIERGGARQSLAGVHDAAGEKGPAKRILAGAPGPGILGPGMQGLGTPGSGIPRSGTSESP